MIRKDTLCLWLVRPKINTILATTRRAGSGQRCSPIKSFPWYGQYDSGIINVLNEEKLKMDWLSASQQQSYREHRPHANLLMAYLAPRQKGSHLHLKYYRQYLRQNNKKECNLPLNRNLVRFYKTLQHIPDVSKGEPRFLPRFPR